MQIDLYYQKLFFNNLDTFAYKIKKPHDLWSPFLLYNSWPEPREKSTVTNKLPLLTTTYQKMFSELYVYSLISSPQLPSDIDVVVIPFSSW